MAMNKKAELLERMERTHAFVRDFDRATSFCAIAADAIDAMDDDEDDYEPHDDTPFSKETVQDFCKKANDFLDKQSEDA